MNTNRMVSEIKAEIQRLQQVLALLEGQSATPSKRGPKKGRKLSAETRAKMKAAQQARWAKKAKDAK